MEFSDLFFTVIVPALAAIIAGLGAWWLAGTRGASQVKSVRRRLEEAEAARQEAEEELERQKSIAETRALVLLRWQENYLRPLKQIVKQHRLEETVGFVDPRTKLTPAENRIVAEVAEEVESLLEADVQILPELLRTLGLLYFTLRKEDLAARYFELALRADSMDEDARANLGSIHLRNRNWDSAVEQYKALVEIASNRHDAHFGLGIAHIGGGRAEKAIEALTTAIRLAPEDARTYCELGRACMLNGELQRAIDAVQVALKINPRSMDAHLMQHELLLRMGEFAEAAKQCERLLKLGEVADVYYNLARARALMEDADGAFDALRKAVQLDDRARFRAKGESAFTPLSDKRRFRELLEGKPGLF